MRLTAIVPATDRPPTLDACVSAIRSARDEPEELVVVDSPAGLGAAGARNAGAARAGGDVLVFVDSDVLVHHDAFTRIRAAFAARPGLTAIFGSYDAAPGAPGAVSAFRDLLHHHVHRSSAGPASTFWAGVGAIRRDAFVRAQGFDAARYPDGASVEDIELGMRLARDGARIELDPLIQGTHMKAWTLRAMVATDLRRRGVPWVAAILRHRGSSTALNLGWRHRLSAAASVAAVGGGLAGRRTAPPVAVGALLALNVRFYAVLLRRGGPRVAAAGVPLHVLHHLTSVAAVPLGVVAHLAERRGSVGRVGSSPS